MKKSSIYLFLMISLCSCNHTPSKLYDSVISLYRTDSRDSCYINLKEALNIDYDVLYMFDSLIPLSGVRDIIGIPEYGGNNASGNSLIGKDSEMCRIIFVKNSKVVYEDEYYYDDYNLVIDYHNFDLVKGHGTFDGKDVETEGYISRDSLFVVTRTDGIFILKRRFN